MIIRRRGHETSSCPRIIHKVRAALGLVLAAAACSCAGPPACARNRPTAAGDVVCAVPGWEERSYLMHLPTAYDGKTALPEDREECLSKLADREGFIVVYPDGLLQEARAALSRGW